MPSTPVQSTLPLTMSRYAASWRLLASNLGLIRLSSGRQDPAFRINCERPRRWRLLPEGLVPRTCINTTGAQKDRQQVSLNLSDQEVARSLKFVAADHWPLPRRSNLGWRGSSSMLSHWETNRGQPGCSARNCSESLAVPRGYWLGFDCLSV